ncbi:MAG: phosphate ABC transporter permease PstA [Verrucomicrobiota bacterium]
MHAPINPFQHRRTKSRTAEKVVFWMIRLGTYAVLAAAACIFLNIASKGGKVVFKSTPPFVNVPFLTEKPQTLYVFDYEGKKREMSDTDFRAFKKSKNISDIPAASYAYSAGGIFPCIVGTVLLVAGSMLIALVLGVSSAIYLSEYGQQGRILIMIRLAIMNLAGVPSIVFGLFGFGMFVIFFKWNVSLMAGWFTLAFMVLPVIITASEEALKSVPQGFREGSLALGATKWQAIRTNVLPYALPGILTSSILGIARVAGETAPIMFTAAYVVRDEMPWQGVQMLHPSTWGSFFFQGVTALPYHIYVVSSKIPQNEYTERVQYGSAFVFLFVVMMITLGSILLRNKFRSRYKW